MHTEGLDLNLLRLFDAVYRLRSVSRAAEALGLSQPAASQALTRLRLKLRDPLFMRAAGGVRPTPRAQRLAEAVQSALASLEQALGDFEAFDPGASRMALRLHLSDIGEARFLPALMAALGREAPGIAVQSLWLPHAQIAPALDGGQLDLAIGFLPGVLETRQQPLLRDRYVVLLAAKHPLAVAGRALDAAALRALEFAAVRSHSETLRILQQLDLQSRVRLHCGSFLALPSIVRQTALGAVLPRAVALEVAAAGGGCTVVETTLPQPEFTVSLHWSRRFESDAALAWVRALVLGLFREAAA